MYLSGSARLLLALRDQEGLDVLRVQVGDKRAKVLSVRLYKGLIILETDSGLEE